MVNKDAYNSEHFKYKKTVYSAPQLPQLAGRILAAPSPNPISAFGPSGLARRVITP